MKTLLIVLTLAPLLGGCFIGRATVNEPLAPPALSNLQPGVSTAREVVERLGAPNEVVQLGRRSAYRYDHSSTKITGTWLLLVGFLNTDTRTDRAWVFFDEKDVLTHVGVTLSAANAEYGMPWSR
jgi:hypothetical protein